MTAPRWGRTIPPLGALLRQEQESSGFTRVRSGRSWTESSFSAARPVPRVDFYAVHPLGMKEHASRPEEIEVSYSHTPSPPCAAPYFAQFMPELWQAQTTSCRVRSLRLRKQEADSTAGREGRMISSGPKTISPVRVSTPTLTSTTPSSARCCRSRMTPGSSSSSEPST